MANRLFTSQFSYSFEKQLAHLLGAFTQVTAGARASLVAGDITLTAKAFGSAGNAITVELLDPAAPSASLTVTVTAKKISVSLATDGGSAITTDYGDLAVALQNSVPASALVTTTGSSATLVAPLTLTPLAGGVDLVSTNNLPVAYMTLSQLSEGEYQILLADKYIDLLSISIIPQCAAPADLVPQMISQDVDAARTIIFRLLALGTGTPVETSLADGDSIYIDINLRNVR